MINASAPQKHRGVKKTEAQYAPSPAEAPSGAGVATENIRAMDALAHAVLAGQLTPKSALETAQREGYISGELPQPPSAAPAEQGSEQGNDKGETPRSSWTAITGKSTHRREPTREKQGEAQPSAVQFYGNGTDYSSLRDGLLRQAEDLRFDYNPREDTVWQSYLKQYRREGQRAAEDVLGRAAALTGGVASSYAASAAAQAENNYAAQLSDRLPEVYQSAYNRYLREFERLLSLADAYERYGKRENEWQQTLREYEDRLRELG